MAKISNIATRATRTAKVIPLTPGQKAAATKRANGLDLSAVAQKAVATRLANNEAREIAARKAERAAKRAAKKAA